MSLVRGEEGKRWVEQLIFTRLLHENGLILEQFTKILYRDSLNRVNCAYLMSGRFSSNSNSLAVDSIDPLMLFCLSIASIIR